MAIKLILYSLRLKDSVEEDDGNGSREDQAVFVRGSISAMQLWWLFWSAWLVLAGAAFLFITLVVLVRGLGDLRQMIRSIARRDR